MGLKLILTFKKQFIDFTVAWLKIEKPQINIEHSLERTIKIMKKKENMDLAKG